jgi:hypothetical protein
MSGYFRLNVLSSGSIILFQARSSKFRLIQVGSG